MKVYTCIQDGIPVSCICCSIPFPNLLEKIGTIVVNRKKTRVHWIDYMFQVEDNLICIYHKNKNSIFSRWALHTCIELSIPF